MKRGDCLTTGHKILTGETGVVWIDRGRDSFRIPAASVAVMDSPPIIFGQSWISSSWKSIREFSSKDQTFKSVRPSQVAGVRGDQASTSKLLKEVKWFGEEESLPSRRDVEKSYVQIRKYRDAATDTALRDKLSLYLADLAGLLSRPEEARAHLQDIPPSSPLYSQAKDRLKE